MKNFHFNRHHKREWMFASAIGLAVIIFTVLLADTMQAERELRRTNQRILDTSDTLCLGKDAGNFQCQKKSLETIARLSGVEAALSTLKLRYGTNPYIASQCHQLAHVIGNTAAHQFATISEAFGHGDSFCWSGYYHGVLEEAVSMKGRPYVETHLDTFCAELPGKSRYDFDYYNCVHGLGHGVMSITRNELFESLGLCDTMNGDWEKHSCASGVFMENVMADNRDHYSKYLKTDDLMYPCDAVSEKYKSDCYLMQTSYVLSKNAYDFRDVFKRCAAVEEPYRAICAQSAGRDASGNTISNPDSTNARCALALGEEQERNCIIGAAKDFMSYYHSTEQAEKLCAIVSPALTETCRETVTSYAKQFN